jgi:hypothetical protein
MYLSSQSNHLLIPTSVQSDHPQVLHVLAAELASEPVQPLASGTDGVSLYVSCYDILHSPKKTPQHMTERRITVKKI